MEILTILLTVYGIPLALYLGFALSALHTLRTRDLDDTSRAVWTLDIVAIPVRGAVAFAIMQPGTRR